MIIVIINNIDHDNNGNVTLHDHILLILSHNNATNTIVYEEFARLARD